MRRRAPSLAAAAAAALALAVAACGLPAPPTVAPDVSAPESAVSATTVGGELRPVVPPLVPYEAPVPPRPWLGAAVDVVPAVPREGQAMAVRVVTPRTGRAAVSVEGTLAGDEPVRFGSISDREWVGLAPLPVGRSGREQLSLRIAAGEGDTVTVRRTVRVRDYRFPSTRLSVAPRYSSPPDSVMDRIRSERQLLSDTLTVVTDRWLWDGRFTWPRPHRVTSPFGERRVFNGELRSRHWGLDLAGRTGDPVRAAARGRVILTHHLYYTGNTVFLDHGHGVITGYCHLSEIDVSEGDTVESGQVLGEVGATGRVTGPHLHWILLVGGERLDASSLMQIDVF